ncbi:hypothetical protein [Actinoplanes subglobosus]|uniref:Uncharacterized protein n=1 Tax=Actinoplanes subglobosus TaxID=1547892 RepID=A0ABV8IR58_9ACTN
MSTPTNKSELETRLETLRKLLGERDDPGISGSSDFTLKPPTGDASKILEDLRKKIQGVTHNPPANP